MATFAADVEGASDDAMNQFICKVLLRNCNDLMEIYKQGKKIENPDQVKEVMHLLDHCNDRYPFQARSTSCKLLIRLCKNHILSKDYLLKKMLTLSATARDLVCVIFSVWEIIKLEIEDQLRSNGTYICPYKMRSPTHPFITIIQQRSDASDIIINEIKHCYMLAVEKSTSRILPHLLNALKPFLAFVILDPERATKSWDVHALHTCFVQLLSTMYKMGIENVSLEIANFLFKLIQYRKTVGSLISDSVILTEQLALCLLELPKNDRIENTVVHVGYHIMSQCLKLIDANRNIFVHLNLLKKIFSSYPEGFLTDEFVYLLALLHYRCPTMYIEAVLELELHVIPCYALICGTSRPLTVLKAFVLPLIVTMSNATYDEEHRNCQKLSRNLFKNIEDCLLSSSEPTDMESDNNILTKGHPAAELLIGKHHCTLLRGISWSTVSARGFLRALNDSQRHCDSIMLIFSTLLVHPRDADLLKETLATVSSLSKAKPKMAADFLPLMLYTANGCNESKIKFGIIESLPSLASHKQMVSPVLKTLLMLGNSLPLLPLAIKLTKDLWKMQPRIFPHLMQLLLRKAEQRNMSEELREELLLSKATCVLEICKLRPAQHGPDVIGLLAKIFDEFEQGMPKTKASVADTVVYLSLESLRLLCEAEVSDFQTAWAVVSTKVLSSKSDIVLKGIISFLSVAPSVLGKSASDLELRRYACNFIWNCVDHENGNIGSFALACLANFPFEEFTVERLPEKVRTVTSELLIRKQNLKKRPEGDEFDPFKEHISGPGYAFLLRSLNESVANGYNLLLEKVLKKEVETLPRSISSANTARKLGSAYEKFIDGIPEFMRAMYEKTNRPALVPGLAAGLLSCYMTSIQHGKNEKIGRRHLIDDAKINRQMLDNLLSEVALDPSDWHHSLTAPTSWSRLMGRVFDVTVDGRKAELSLLYDQGRIPSEADLKSEIENSVYWARDQLTNQLMKASRGNPAMQGNSVMALAGLAVKISAGGGQNDEKEENTSGQYISKRDWLMKAADTIMVVLDGNFKPKGVPMQWCQQFSSSKSTASSLLSRAAAAIAVSEVAATLISVDLERIQQMMQLLSTRIAGQEKAGKSSIIQFCSAIGLGLVVNRLQQQRFIDIIGQEGYLLSARAGHLLEKTMYNEDLLNREGATFGYGLALCATFTESAKDSRVYASMAYQRLFDAVKNIDASKEPTSLDQGFFFALALSTVSGFAAGLIGADTISEVVKTLETVCKSYRMSVVLQASYGSLLHGTLCCGFSKTKDIIDAAVDSLLLVVTDKNNEVAAQIAAINGLLSAFGANFFIFQFDDVDGFDATLKNKLAVAIKTLQQVVDGTDDATLCTHTCRLLGLLHFAHLGGAPRQTAIPGNYNYLSDWSILRNLFNCLVEAGKSGPIGEYTSSAVNAILSAFIAASSLNLPPVNWALVLSPLMKLGFDVTTRCLSLKFAILNVSSSATIPTWLLSWMNPPVFLSLDLDCKEVLLGSVDKIIKFVPIHKVKMIIEDTMVKAFHDDDASYKQRQAVLTSLKGVAGMSNPVQSCLLCVKCALERICAQESILKDKDIVKEIADCVLSLPNELQKDFMNGLQTTDLIIRIESSMVTYFGSPLKIMERSFELFSADPINTNPLLVTCLKTALQRHYLNSSSSKERDEQVLWLLEQMGRITPLMNTKQHETGQCWLAILATTMSIWSSSGLYLPIIDNFADNLYNAACWDLFGLQLKSFLESPSWKHLQGKVLEWLITLTENFNYDEKNEVMMSFLRGEYL